MRNVQHMRKRQSGRAPSSAGVQLIHWQRLQHRRLACFWTVLCLGCGRGASPLMLGAVYSMSSDSRFCDLKYCGPIGRSCG